MEDAGSHAGPLGQRPQWFAVLGTAQMNDRPARRRAEGVGHVGRQRQDDVIGDGKDGQIGKIDRGGRALTGAGAELVRQVADVIGVAAADGGDGVACRVQGTPQGRTGAAGSDDGDGRLLHDSVSVHRIQAASLSYNAIWPQAVLGGAAALGSQLRCSAAFRCSYSCWSISPRAKRSFRMLSAPADLSPEGRRLRIAHTTRPMMT